MSGAAEVAATAGPPRRFLALGVPAAERRAIAAATTHLRGDDAGLRPTSPEGWHITLAYLGAVDAAAAELAVTALDRCLVEEAPRPAPRLAVTGAGRFGDRVLLLELGDDPRGALAGFVASLHARLRDVGFDLPGRGFRAHLTLARARGRHRVRGADVDAIDVPGVRWRPRAVGLWSTVPTGQPGSYVVETEIAWPPAR